MARVLLYIFLFSSTAWADIEVSDLSGHTTKCKLAYGIITGEATEAGFLEEIRKNPDDTDLLMIYSEWLEQNGKPDEGEFIRLQVLNEPVRERIRKQGWNVLSKGEFDTLEDFANDAEANVNYTKNELKALVKDKALSKEESDNLWREQELLERNKKKWIPAIVSKAPQGTDPLSYRLKRGLLEVVIVNDELPAEVVRLRIQELFENVPTLKHVLPNRYDYTTFAERMLSSDKIPIGEPYALHTFPYSEGSQITVTRNGADFIIGLDGWLARPIYLGVFQSNGKLIRVIAFTDEGQQTVPKVPEGSYVRWIGYGGTTGYLSQ